MDRCRRALRLLIGCLFLMSEGCVAVSVAPSDYQVARGSGTGLVVISFSQPGSDFHWWYRDIAGTRYRVMDTWEVSRHATVRDGRTILFPVELPAGVYEIYGWTVQTGSPRGPNPGHEISDEPFLIRFRCVADQVTYVGNLQLELVSEKRFTLHVRNLQLEDVAELLETYKNLRPEMVHVELMSKPVRAEY